MLEKVFIAILAVFVGTAIPALAWGVHNAHEFAAIYTPLITGGIMAYVAWSQYKLAERQHELTREQRALVEQQVKIASDNKDIAHRKYHIDLFEKRFDVYSSWLTFMIKCRDFRKNIYDYISISDEMMERKESPEIKMLLDQKCNEMRENLSKARKEMRVEHENAIKAIHQSTFIFDNDVHDYMLEKYGKARILYLLKVQKLYDLCPSNDLIIKRYYEKISDNLEADEREVGKAVGSTEIFDRFMAIDI